MAGILANSISKTMVAGDTSVNNSISGYVEDEQITLSTTPTGTTYQWGLSLPDGSTTARASLSSTTAASPVFTPDLEGEYFITCTVDGTAYTLIATVLPVATSNSVQVVRLQGLANASVPAPTAASAINLYKPSDHSGPAYKDSTGTVRHLAVAGGADASYGSFYISASAPTSIGFTQTWTKAAGTTTTDLLQNFDANSVNNRLRYLENETAIFHVDVSFSMTAASANKTFRFGIAKNGTILTQSIVARKIATSTDVGAASAHALLSMATNDYVELFVANWTDDTNITIDFASFVVTQAL
jgi:hypothetical protein